MNDKIMIVCDADVMYARRLVERMIKDGCFTGNRYKIQVFDSLMAVLEYSETVPVSVLILGDNLLAEGTDDMYVKLKSSRIHLIYLLTEDNISTGKEYPWFYKYQPSSELIRSIEAAIISNNVGTAVLADNDVKILGVFSPRGCVEKTVFAYITGLLLGRKKAALYVNLERYSGFEALLGRKTDKTMTEAIFYLLREDDVAASAITEIFEEYEGLYYLPSIKRAVEFEGLKADMLPRCILKLKEIVQLEKLKQRLIILEFNGAVQGYMELMKLCDSLYIVEREDGLSRRSLEDFYEEVQAYDSNISVRFRVINVPIINEFAEDEFIETRLGREYESVVQNILKKEGLLEGGVKKQTN